MPIPIWYTFGNHMHWVDMQWLWGYHVLPGSIRDMLDFCRETGAKGNVNFDGIGYEKLASENPEALWELREAVQAGTIEVVGASYGQPYGLFHGGEPNIRQRIYGTRAVMRLLGVRPKAFWEEEFDFFPQLPQMLRGVGFEYASLFFQWTWHTPEIPKEEAPVIWWEGIDGSKLLTATRNRLNLHQWPEDIDILMNQLAESPPEGEQIIQQWLELMPSPDWMCRSEVLLPKTKELLSDRRFDFKFGTLSDCIRGTSFEDVVSSGFQPESPVCASKPSPEEPEIRKGAYLPHLTKQGGTYAISFRLADALPQSIQKEIALERERLQDLNERGLIRTEATKQEYRRLFAEKIEDALAAGHGRCVLAHPSAAQIVRDALYCFHGERYRLHAWCIMPNHVHAVVEPLGGVPLKEILHSWKSYTANKVNALVGSKGAFWQVESYDHLVRGRADYENQIQYVLENPVKAGLRDWVWVGRVEGVDWRAPEVDGDREAAVLGLEARGDHGQDGRATPVRCYSMDEVWHGMSLGKNGDFMRKESARCEGMLLDAEVLAAIAGVFGRPYAQWDVYPTWELEEAWRELLQAQHHDNDECEGLCGHVGKTSYERSHALSYHVVQEVGKRLQSSLSTDIMINSLGWERVDQFGDVLPAFGFGQCRLGGGVWFKVGEETASAVRGLNRFELDLSTSKLRIESSYLTSPNGIYGEVEYVQGGTRHSFEHVPAQLSEADNGEVPLSKKDSLSNELCVLYDVSHEHEGVDLEFVLALWTKPDPGMNASAQARFGFPCENPLIFADTPYAVSEVQARNSNQKKYPTGDWMTSPQWFETVEDSFTSFSFVDLVHPITGDGLLILHDGHQQWFRRDGEVRCILNMVDPWDGDYFDETSRSKFRLLPHGRLRNSQRYKLAQEFRRYAISPEGNEFNRAQEPHSYSFASCKQDNVVMTALYRETRESSPNLVHYSASAFEADYPYVIRLVEFDGIAGDAEIRIAATVAAACKTNLLGEDGLPLALLREGPETSLTVPMRPYEIATIYLDIVEGRKQTRDLDAARNVWATVHRVEDE
ncbi:MAG: transposase [Fimbriimonas sp.]